MRTPGGPGPLLLCARDGVTQHMCTELPFHIDYATAVTLRVPAIRRMLKLFSSPPILLKPGLWNHDVDMVPGQSLIQVSLPELALHIKPGFFDCALPRTKVQVFVPGIEPGAVPEGRLQKVRCTAVCAGHQPL